MNELINIEYDLIFHQKNFDFGDEKLITLKAA
jgi:hypothetical protein